MILVTGADGFIGSHLVEKLVLKGFKVRAFCFYNSFGTLGWLDTLDTDVKAQFEIFTGDIRDAYAVRKAMDGITTVFHLAALIAIPYSYYSPESYIDTNIKGTLNILQAAKDFSTERVIITSTSEVYGTAQFVPITEAHPKQPQSPYSASKIGADSLADSFFRSFNTPITIARPFNTFGPRQSARAVIPTIITQLLAGKTQIKLGDIRPTRDLLFVQDTVDAFIEIAATTDLIGEEVNIATQSEHSIGEIAEVIIKTINPDAKLIVDEVRLRPAKSEVFRLFGSNEKLRNHTKWKPNYTLEQGLVETIRWFRDSDNLKNYKAEIYNV